MPYSTDDLRDLIIELDKKVDRVINSVDSIKIKQDEINGDLSKIKDPEHGLFTRVRSLEEWRGIHTKLTWVTITTLIPLAMKQIWDMMTTHQ